MPAVSGVINFNFFGPFCNNWNDARRIGPTPIQHISIPDFYHSPLDSGIIRIFLVFLQYQACYNFNMMWGSGTAHVLMAPVTCLNHFCATAHARVVEYTRRVLIGREFNFVCLHNNVTFSYYFMADSRQLLLLHGNISILVPF